jgi:threonine/homoserine/homoserine lactone efflux protein
MVSSGRLLEFAAVAFVVIVIPGPSVLFVVGRTLSYGHRSALASVAGNESGEFVLAAAAALGVGSLIQRSAILFTSVKLAGAAYLVILGIRALIQRREHALAETLVPARSLPRAVADGFLVGVTNPKTAVFFAAVLPQFVNRSAGHVPAQMRRLEMMGGAGGLAMIGLGITLAVTGRKD